jgi:hypothetical protein
MQVVPKDKCRHEVILEEIRIAVGRVKVYEGVHLGGHGLLPELVASLTADHDEIEDRVTVVVDYIRSLPEAVRTTPELQQIGRLLQGDEPEIVDLQG